ncbi:ABC-2 type transport system ATP-binding protein [Anaeroplasma bactoclasticum]|jgi:ABC-2 type transport system ATP-binding protein|uniref:ABC-2 type transport system ATP-binding protein n=1 Tax=Anaeroplasma bactoclasticum TaxID=2088 RepID=A0A397S161_9MOLU|nr:ABC transporter ATP-binding protein [Anaeroplasma bactoclasticum]RIA78145.1 ABC-2 type transport system ATP-binding protein [Anaeroplasma bactoclasticum]
MIEIKNVTKCYDKNKVILEDVNATIPDGSIVGLIGLNGAGKSTLLRLIAGVYEPDSGDILFDGESIYKDERVKRRLFYVPDEPYFRRGETPRSLTEDYRFWFNPLAYYVTFRSHLNKFNINENKPLYKFSKGMKRQTALALGVSVEPKYLFLDEAFDGVDPLARKDLKELLLKNQEKNNSTIILSSHSLRELEDICDTYLVVDETKVYVYNDVSEFSYHRYVMAFDENINEKSFGIHFVRFDKENKIISCVTKLTFKEMKERIAKFNPKLLEEQPMSVEESFIIRMGYDGDRNA